MVKVQDLKKNLPTCFTLLYLTWISPMRPITFIMPLMLIALQCQTLTPYRVIGYFLDGDYVYQTTVDSKDAHDYVFAGYSHAAPTDTVSDIFEQWDKKELNQENLKELAKKTSTDLATLYFSRRVLDNPGNEKSQRRFEEILGSLKQNDFRRNVNLNTLFVFVPGLGYKSDKQIGADFSTQRKALQELGIPNTIIEVDEFGRIMSNAQIIADS